MAPALYMIQASPPVRAVLMTAKAIGLDIEERSVNFFRDEHRKPEFLKMNPQHTIPTLLDDDGFAIWDSHAIMAYLVSKYAKNDDLYPEDLKKRAIINQRLFFESGAIFFHSRNLAISILRKGNTFIDQKEKQGVLEGYAFLEKFLEGNRWVAGDFVSIADYSLLASVSTLNIIIPLNPQEHINVISWLERCKKLPECQANVEGLEEANKLFASRLKYDL